MTTTEIPSQRGSALPPLGPDSLTWHRFGDWRTALLISWSGTLQVMHPVIDAALVQHSTVFDDELARLARSAGPIIRALYDPSGAEPG
ncbi:MULTISPECIES: oxygenase MpaB family protein [Rhodococcus]|uniref:Oxygenase MpaB family protein n=1 Tax=Rhodococcus opacus TaxID=37919 RepID=A0AAX3YEC3_RHOOP|nr:oxygenase MpaB family protein [Rhodococcus opacus]MCZ4586755.1 oxygenase MpaB family protein [Rhodococcus opacus]MDV6243510.1 oxygenase MpaB family protein [Rhodococcus opacus]WLF46620.1 oxygenase MpaB family protein [Rhodococcus opacus]